MTDARFAGASFRSVQIAFAIWMDGDCSHRVYHVLGIRSCEWVDGDYCVAVQLCTIARARDSGGCFRINLPSTTITNTVRNLL